MILGRRIPIYNRTIPLSKSSIVEVRYRLGWEAVGGTRSFNAVLKRVP